MATTHVEQLSHLMKNLFPSKIKKLEIKHFFSGAAVYANGTICATLTPKGFALKLSKKKRKELINKKKGKPLRYFPKSPIKKEYVVFPQSKLKDQKFLRPLVQESIDYAEKK
jgi:TfoX/Sxy family transcriptional regulator of competence genes